MADLKLREYGASIPREHIDEELAEERKPAGLGRKGNV